MKTRKQFTLIELIAVIVILAIIAIVAVPKYMGLQDDAKISAAMGVYGALQGATSMDFAEQQLDPTNYTAPTTVGDYLEAIPDGWTANATTLTLDSDGTFIITVAAGTLNPAVAPVVTKAGF